MSALLALALLFALDAGTPPPLMPLSVGDEWLYEGTVKWTEPVTNEIKSATISWKTRVVVMHESNGSRVAVLHGSPLELAWFAPNQQPAFSVLVESPSGLFTASASSRQEADTLARRALQKTADLEQLVQYPVRIGSCLGENPGRKDRLYCWLVSRKISEAGKQGWELEQRTLPDEQSLRIMPSVGITRYQFSHHGTVASADVHLVAFTKAP